MHARDANRTFERGWLQAHGDLASRWATANPAPPLANAVDEVRREAFRVASSETGRHELASHVSDDFDTIARAVAKRGRSPAV